MGQRLPYFLVSRMMVPSLPSSPAYRPGSMMWQELSTGPAGQAPPELSIFLRKLASLRSTGWPSSLWQLRYGKLWGPPALGRTTHWLPSLENLWPRALGLGMRENKRMQPSSRSKLSLKSQHWSGTKTLPCALQGQLGRRGWLRRRLQMLLLFDPKPFMFDDFVSFNLFVHFTFIVLEFF